MKFGDLRLQIANIREQLFEVQKLMDQEDYHNRRVEEKILINKLEDL